MPVFIVQRCGDAQKKGTKKPAPSKRYAGFFKCQNVLDDADVLSLRTFLALSNVELYFLSF